jgi:hypothetical protein
MRTISLVWYLLAVAGTASAQTVNPSDVHQLGAVAVTIPPPPGFEQVPGSDQRFARTRVLGIFVRPGIPVIGSEVLPTIGVVDVLPDMRETDVTAADFAALKASFRMPEVLNDLAALIQRSMMELMPLGNDAVTTMPIPALGLIDEDRNSVSLVFGWGIQVGGVAVLSVIADTTLFVRGRLLMARLMMVGVSSEDAGKQAITPLARSWAEAILTANAAP